MAPAPKPTMRVPRARARAGEPNGAAALGVVAWLADCWALVSAELAALASEDVLELTLDRRSLACDCAFEARLEI